MSETTKFIHAGEWTAQDYTVEIATAVGHIIKTIPIVDKTGKPIAYVISDDTHTPLDQAKHNAALLAAAPDLRHATTSFMASMNNVEQFPGHNQAYRETVCVPRATIALKKLS